MARPLHSNALSLTGGGVALVTAPDGSIHPDAVEGLVIGDRRVVSAWHLDVVGATAHRVGWQRTGPSSDRLVSTITTDAAFDPIAVLERRRSVHQDGFDEEITITAYSHSCRCTLWLTAERDDQVVFHLGDTDRQPDDPGSTRTLLDPVDGAAHLRAPAGGVHDVAVDAAGWHASHHALAADVDIPPGQTWTTRLSVRIADSRASTPVANRRTTSAAIATTPTALGEALDTARADLRALTTPLDGGEFIAAGSPYFLALFGRDSMIAGLQSLIESTRPLLDVLGQLARHQATHTDDASGAQPGRILHELRVGRAGVFGLPPGTPYYGAVDTSPLFAVALGEAARWGAPAADIAALLPAARAALRWCAEHGDVDGDGFVESVPHSTGLINLGWKDSADSTIDRNGAVITGAVALSEVQAYWYRGLRSVAELERRYGDGDGADLDAEADRLETRFAERFVYDTPEGPYVGLALDDHKQLLDVRTSNAGHVLWAGILAPDVADSVATQLGGPDMFSGWGIRTLSSSAVGYNPFGYHRGSVWPHDTAIGMLGAARRGRSDVVQPLAEGLLALARAGGGQLPELTSGLSRADTGVPVPYLAACRPQAWAAGALLMATQAMLGLDVDVPRGRVALDPCLPDDTEMIVRDLVLGDHVVSFVVRGAKVVDVSTSGIDVVVAER